MLAVAPHVHIAFVGGTAIVLDTRADRYRRLPSALAAALRDVEALSYERNRRESARLDPRHDAAIIALRAHGVLVDAPAGRALARAAPSVLSHSALDAQSSAGAHSPTAIRIWWALLAARRSLRRRGLHATLAQVGARGRRARASDPDRAARHARRFEAVRAWYPAPRGCLADSIALHAAMSRAGVSCDLVIGVRDAPFAAHCWVEADGVLLNDTLDHVGELTPILRL